METPGATVDLDALTWKELRSSHTLPVRLLLQLLICRYGVVKEGRWQPAWRGPGSLVATRPCATSGPGRWGSSLETAGRSSRSLFVEELSSTAGTSLPLRTAPTARPLPSLLSRSVITTLLPLQWNRSKLG